VLTVSSLLPPPLPACPLPCPACPLPSPAWPPLLTFVPPSPYLRASSPALGPPPCPLPPPLGVHSERTKVPVWPFSLVSVFLGAFALLPYFALWTSGAPRVPTEEERGS